jgi:ABC-type nitrate/sulfonate/bicarbonate transport system substrate-binding protein
LENYPHLVDCLLQQAYLAGEWAQQHPRETLALLSREVGWSESWIQYAYGAKIHQNLRLDLSAENINRLSIFKDFLLQHQLIEQDFSVKDWVDHEPLDRLLKKQRAIAKRKPAVAATRNTTAKAGGLIH